MRLKTLELKGFKSFADETVIHFGENVIGIVGPNGSGKSNIVDAIRWVLGEQSSRELRLDQMSNVIFNGTKKRKQAPLAQVALTFENTKNLLPTEYQNVTITRILYQSGDSEYRLNNVQCRLKDITSLFLDTGIGSNSYAIIALGMVDDILNDKDNSRLRMLEQAAGISKYKIRKRETLNKLKNTDADLERVEDLLFEIENNLKTLEQQAKKTKRFFELKEKYKELSLQLAGIKFYSLKEKHHSIKAQLEKEEDQYRNFDVESNRIEALLEAERKGHLDKEKALTDRQKELNNLVGSIRGLENERNMLRQRSEFINQNRDKLEQQIRNHTVRTSELEQQIIHYREEISEEKRLEEKLEVQLSEAEAALKSVRESHNSTKEGLDEILKVQQAKEKELFELEKQKAINLNRLDNLHQEVEQMETSVFQRKLEFESLQDKIKATEEEEQKQKEVIELLQKEEDKRQQDVQQAEVKADELHKKITSVNRELDAKRNEFKLTQSMVENLEGFPESIKFLSSQKEWAKTAPLLSDLIYVKEEYRVAIENYLDAYLNYYVVPTLADAYKAIRLLNQSQKGKANFFILEAFKDYQPPMALTPEVMSAMDLVETDPAYRNLCSFLLENVVIVDEAQAEKAPQSDDQVILSKSGHFVKKKFSVSGGSIGLFEGKKIGRKKNLEVLENAIKKLEREADKYSTEFYNYKSKIELLKGQRDERKMREVQNSLNTISTQKVTLLTRLDNLRQILGESDEKHEKISTEVEVLTQQNLEIERELDEKTEKLTESKAQIAEVDSSYREMSDKLSQASAAFNEKNISFIRQQNKVSTLQRELSFREKSLEELQAGLQKDKRTLEEAEDEKLVLADELKSTEEKLQQSYSQRKEKESLLTEAEQVYYKARGGINDLEDQLRKLNKSRNDAQILINSLKDKHTEVRMQISSLAERLRVEFNISINDLDKVLPEELPEEDEGELQLKVERLKNRLDNYGEINPLAVEAYDTMKERYESITQQRDDILKAKEDLLVTIQEIETTATGQFLDSFEKVRTYFIEVFRSLFTEDDTADLILLNPENPLESAIEIIAKPKGKRPQTINQLSGGEKTLTATALLFALYLLKPAPFCIFDEVDAPLDDTNIEKFNKIIKKFSSNSQFVIVTHNKLTMASVDVIYGVYMIDQGISGVSPVDFRNYEHRGMMEVA